MTPPLPVNVTSVAVNPSGAACAGVPTVRGAATSTAAAIAIMILRMPLSLAVAGRQAQGGDTPVHSGVRTLSGPPRRRLPSEP
ncbi:hypothetical protein GCM10009827_114040 [Dactylosporangium maewongense]|uniref:Uncharacterized protein n=1 Tax=Dactylosporangium maewongense TaxID=634393 RepID=A0ABN2DAV3_9ACTN